ncbi:MAG: hypothetical protein ACO3DK_00355 [Bacteroidia bacterium]
MRNGALALVLLLVSCQAQTETPTQSNPLWSLYSRELFQEAQNLNALQPGLVKTISRGEQVQSETIDSCDFLQEYAVFLNYDLALSEKRYGPYAQTIDSSGELKQLRYTCSDTAAELRSFQILSQSGKPQLLEWSIVRRSFLMDRTLELSLQPGKGFRLWVKEDPLWASPTEYEIFTEIHQPQTLQNR